MLVPPAGQGIVDIDQFLGQLIEVETAFGVAIDREPRGADRVAVADREAGAGERGIGLVPQRRLGERGAQPGLPRVAAFLIVEEIRDP